jgi:DNA-binding response OmpR family regulator
VRVLLVEDAPRLRTRLVALLSQLPGTQVVAATGGVEESIAAARDTMPDLVVLDLRLADGSGFDVLRELKSWCDGPVVLMLTLDPNEANRRHFHALGGEYFFDKVTQLGEALVLIASLARRTGSPGSRSGEASDGVRLVH